MQKDEEIYATLPEDLSSHVKNSNLQPFVRIIKGFKQQLHFDEKDQEKIIEWEKLVQCMHNWNTPTCDSSNLSLENNPNKGYFSTLKNFVTPKHHHPLGWFSVSHKKNKQEKTKENRNTKIINKNNKNTLKTPKNVRYT